MKLGSETLSGVLYHPDYPGPSTSFCQSNDVGAIIPYTPNSKRRYGRRRRSKRRGDPSYPKPNRSGYNFFFAEKHYKLKSLYPNREREFTKMIGESWTNLSPEERKVKAKKNCIIIFIFLLCGIVCFQHFPHKWRYNLLGKLYHRLSIELSTLDEP